MGAIGSLPRRTATHTVFGPQAPLVGAAGGSGMEERHEKSKFPSPSPKEIIACLCDSLDTELSTHDYSELLDQIKWQFETYWFQKIVVLGEPTHKMFDNAISALQEIATIYPSILEWDWKGIIEKFAEEGADFNIDLDIFDPSSILHSKGFIRREKRLNALLKDLINVRDKINLNLQVIQLNLQKLRPEEPKNWLSWALWTIIRSGLHDRHINNKQIDYAVYSLLRLGGVEQKEFLNPADMISKRVRRFSKKYNLA